MLSVTIISTLLITIIIIIIMTALLMRWQVIPANFVVFFVIDLIFEIPRDHMLPRVKKKINK